MSLYDDAIMLAEAVIDEWWEGHFGDYDDYKYNCTYCDGKADHFDYRNPRSLQHDIDCPVLVALDVLTKKEQCK